MKLSSIELHPANSSDACVMSFKDPSGLNPYNVKEILGLDAEEILNERYMGFNDIQLSEVYLLRREPVILVQLNPNFRLGQTYSSLRDALYRMIWTSRRELVQLLFKDGVDSIAAVNGVISKFETTQFSDTQTVKITIKCEEPLLKAVANVSALIPASNPLNLSVNDTKSTAPHGFAFQLEILKDTPSLLVGSPGVGTNYGMLINPSLLGGFQVGDVLHGSSEHGNKYLYVVRGGIQISLLDAVEFNSSWPVIFPGANTLFAKNPNDLLKIVAKWVSITYYPTYWGV